jgi:hypothetical protein
MDALRLTLRAELRRRWRTMLGLAVLLGVIGGVVLTAAAGAQRTDTAYPRLLRSANAAQLLLITGGPGPAAFRAQLSRLPQGSQCIGSQPVRRGATGPAWTVPLPRRSLL